MRLRLEQKLIKEQEEIKFKQLQKEAMRIQKELEMQRRRMDALSPPVSKKSSLFIQVESRPSKPTPAQKACVHQTKTVTVNDAGNRMSQSMTADMFASALATDKFDQRLLSPQFTSSGTSLESMTSWEQQQRSFTQQQQQQQHSVVMQQSSQGGPVFHMTAMPLQSVGSIFKNNINQLG